MALMRVILNRRPRSFTLSKLGFARQRHPRTLFESREIKPVLGLLGVLVIALSAPRTACARSGNSFLETIGISIAVGTVLGASTLSFYDQPGSHLMNLAYGASAGAVAGIGIGLYQMLSGGSSDNAYACHADSEKTNIRTSYRASKSRTELASWRSGSSVWNNPMISPRPSARPVLVWMPLVSLTW